MVSSLFTFLRCFFDGAAFGKSFSRRLTPQTGEENRSSDVIVENKKCHNFLLVCLPHSHKLRIEPIACVSETNENVSDDVRGPARKLAVWFFSLLLQFTFSFWLGKFCGGKLRSAVKFTKRSKESNSGLDKKCSKCPRKVVQTVSCESLALLQWFFSSFSGEAHEEEKFSRSPYRVFFSLSVSSCFSLQATWT